MARNNGRTVYQRTDGQWANKANDALRASGFHETVELACSEATAMLELSGGGALTVRNADGDVLNHLVSPPTRS
ncbi:hypothetical protein AYO47_00290 [Planctomyces sp. SCGC AG-212-M04]|nr:hypothetical protein AYO47_00290 [Planctomyces sp. SCGC AG-212-M04]